MDFGDEPEGSDSQRQRKRYHRHTPRQIQQLEAMFKECPHPDENQRAALSRELGLEPRQIKFWFQNRRTQMKAQHERADNCFLRAENDKIRCENITMREALKNVICPSCGGPPVAEDFFDEQKLRMENARLKEELDRVSSITSKYLGRPFTQMPPVPTMSVSSLDLSNKWMEFFPGIVSKAQTVDVLVNGLCGRSESLIMVTWVEHLEIEHMLPINVLYRNLVLSGAAFGAHRWLAALQRACERFASLATLGVPHHDVAGVTPEGKRSMMRLSQRMVSSFCASLSSSPLQRWTLLSGTTDVSVCVSTHRSTDSGQPNGVVLSAATSIWLPVPGDHVFAFVRDENARSQWDVLSHGNQVQEVSRIPNGSNPGNCISLLRGLNANQNSMLILQESCADASGALVVYSPIDIPAANVVMSGEDPSGIPLLPSGFAILPDGRPGSSGAGASSSAVPLAAAPPPPGCVVTVAFQILVSNLPSSRLNAESVATVNSLIGTTVQQIKAALNCAGP
ncbi:Homeobox-leucine zipper protein HDG11 [Zea mays]|uniref:Homeobox-leucine zipper protein HDG11 n=1 Tax=Zea mays TaxID=4577 RepID=A0A1D6NSI4_MAIZE|nr:Homeobox-leucine zipper protein HDG11 [Zea mays]